MISNVLNSCVQYRYERKEYVFNKNCQNYVACLLNIGFDWGSDFYYLFPSCGTFDINLCFMIFFEANLMHFISNNINTTIC